MNPKDEKRILDIKADLDPGDELQENIKIFKRVNLAMPEPVSGIPPEEKEFPLDLDNLSMSELVNYLALYTKEFAYASWLAAMAKTEVIILEREIEIIGAKAYFLADGAITDKRNVKALDEGLLETTKDKAIADAKLTMLQALVTVNEKYIFAISRKIASLQGEMSLR